MNFIILDLPIWTDSFAIDDLGVIVLDSRLPIEVQELAIRRAHGEAKA